MENVMNKNLRLLWAVALLVLGCSGTQNKSSHLNGPIMEYDSIPNERYVECTPLNIKDKHLCSGLMSVCDTLLIFAHPSWDMQLQVINLNTGLCVGEMCPTGRSHNTYSNARQFGQFVKENGEVKLWVHNRLKSLDLINISRSIEQDLTVFDRRIEMDELEACHTTFGFLSAYWLEGDKFVGNVCCYRDYSSSNEDYIPNHLVIFEGNTDNEVRSYKLYNKGIHNPQIPHIEHPFIFYESYYTLSPDKSHLAWGMLNADMINIVDLKSGKVQGSHKRGSGKIADMEGVMTEAPKQYFLDVCSDNKYIYALYGGHLSPERNMPNYADCIMIFDWDGVPMSRIMLSKSINKLAVDASSSTIYLLNEIDEEVYRIDSNI